MNVQYTRSASLPTSVRCEGHSAYFKIIRTVQHCGKPLTLCPRLFWERSAVAASSAALRGPPPPLLEHQECLLQLFAFFWGCGWHQLLAQTQQQAARCLAGAAALPILFTLDLLEKRQQSSNMLSHPVVEVEPS